MPEEKVGEAEETDRLVTLEYGPLGVEKKRGATKSARVGASIFASLLSLFLCSVFLEPRGGFATYGGAIFVAFAGIAFCLLVVVWPNWLP